MNNIKYFYVLFIIFLALQTVSAQNKNLPAEQELVRQLTEAYNKFDSEKSVQLLNLAFKSLDKFSSEDRIQVYKIAGFIAFQNGNSGLAVDHFWNLLNIDPTYDPDPVTTPPKLLTLFQKTKIEFLKDMNRRLLQLQTSEKPETPWRAVLFPGWEQWRRGYQTKGAVLTSLGTVTLGGLVYSAVQTRSKRNQYRNAAQPDLIQAKYSEYNSSYKRQFYFAYGFAAVWAFSQIDLLLRSKPEIRLSPSISIFNSNPSKSASLLLRFSIVL